MRQRAASLIATLVLIGGTAAPAAAAPVTAPTESHSPPKSPVATGFGGAVSSVDADATAIGLDALRHGGTAADAAIATAAALGVTEPYSSGIGGGGFFVYYDAATHRVLTIDGRETAPAAFTADVFSPGGVPIPFDQAVTSGLSVGVPGSPRTWATALARWGHGSLATALRPAAALARRGFTVDATFRQQTADNEARFRDFPATSAIYLPGGQLPVVGSRLRNPDLARTYDLLARRGVDELYTGQLGREIARTAQKPPVDPAATRNVRPGLMTTEDLAAYYAPFRAPTKVSHGGADVYSMGPPSSGGSTVGEALNILATADVPAMSETDYLHYFLEASKLAFADRNAYVGDPDQIDVPLHQLLSPGFAGERACLIKPGSVLPVQAPGSPDGTYTPCPGPAVAAGPEYHEGLSTTHLVTADRWGNVASYTLTIEQTGGSGITVPGRGFLLNNEMTDFTFGPTPGDPNLPAPGKRPRSSMAPTIVLRGGSPWFATGSPGGATIITTVLQVLLGRIDRGLTLEDAIAAPRASQRNTATTQAEPAFSGSPAGAALTARGHVFVLAPGSLPEIGAAAGVEFGPGGRLTAAAEPVRRGGGAAGVVRPG
ncbi:MAG: gamma-glutamyltranspeptidase / glutathione hydrolase [Cryptosporangiaceae bacterium]|nr:gamma-glutamyltranspeptidase / glutathione hydrolase [Cryptosporangiaceae bacterium]